MKCYIKSKTLYTLNATCIGFVGVGTFLNNTERREVSQPRRSLLLCITRNFPADFYNFFINSIESYRYV